MFASACRTTSPLAVASARARWPAAIACSCAPTIKNWTTRESETCPSRRLVVESHREGFRLAQRRQDTPKFTERAERRAQGEPQINGLLARVARLRQMWQGLSACSKCPAASRLAD